MNERTRHFVLGWVVLFLVLSAVVTLFDVAKDRYQLWTLRRADASEFFLYQGIEYVETTPDHIVFNSTSLVRQSHPMFWNDIIRCSVDGKPLRFYSVQNTNWDSPVIKEDFTTTLWNYSERRPVDGTPCILESTITMYINDIPKVQKLETAFVVGD